MENKAITQYFESARELLNTPKSMQDIFLSAINSYKRKKAVTYINEKGKVISYPYKKYRSYTYEVASKLRQVLSEIPSNSVVALKLKNCPDWIHIFWGILMCGYRPLLIDAKLQKENAQNLINQAHAKAIVTSEIFNYDVLSVNVDSLKDIKANLKFAERWANEVLFCSSGTTGNIKIMIYNGENLAHQIAASLDMPKTTDNIMYPGEINILAIIPFHHIFGFVAVFLWYTFYGKNIVFVKDMSSKEILTTSQRCAVTHVYSVPLFWDSLAQAIIRKAELAGKEKSSLLSKMIAFNTNKIDAAEAGIAASQIAQASVQSQLLGKKIRYCISGGGYISIETMNTINGIGYPLYNGYGMTEIGVTSVELSPKVEYRLRGSIGKPLHGVEYKLINTTKLHPDVGELLVKSKITHIREIINGEECLAQLDDGYLHTGDIAKVDAMGYYYIKGRIKDVIINENGENIYPDEIETYFKEVEGINNVCVFGRKKGRSAHESITCIIELKNDVDEEKMRAIKEACDTINKSLQNEKKVDDFLVFKGILPLTNSLKVKRHEVRELLKIKQSAFASFGEKKAIKAFDGYKKEDVEPIIKTVRKIFAKVLYLPIVRVEDNAHWINDLGGDSMSYIEMVSEIDKEFSITINQEKYGSLTNVNDFCEEILSMKGIAKNK